MFYAEHVVTAERLEIDLALDSNLVPTISPQILCDAAWSLLQESVTRSKKELASEHTDNCSLGLAEWLNQNTPALWFCILLPQARRSEEALLGIVVVDHFPLTMSQAKITCMLCSMKHALFSECPTHTKLLEVSFAVIVYNSQ
ncbi:hypothetical protein J6590_010643 [Homalodisca vitripennis]|nr:hypothetical protein J6590_010643 [Homalodisca vitripennis]